jgi:hypothetical protein
MKAWIVATILAALFASGVVRAQSATATVRPPTAGTVVLMDSTGKVAARPLNETLMLVTVGNGVVAPASIRPIYGPGGHVASALATWQAGGSVLFMSPDCTTGAHVYASPHPGVRAAAQVQTPAGTLLYVGADGAAAAIAIESILYETGCASVTVQQSGLFPVIATVNLSTAYPPPLSFQ